MTFTTPRSNDLNSKNSIAKFLSTGMKGPQGPLRSSAGPFSRQYVATSASISDILQGTLNYRYPSEISNLTNIALTGQLSGLGSSGVFNSSALNGGGATFINGSDHDSGSTDSQTEVPGADASGVSNTVEEAINAGKVLVEHENFRNNGTLKNVLTNGFTIGLGVDGNMHDMDSSLVTVRENGRGYLSPNLVNMLFYMMENGFIIYTDMGTAGWKLASSSNSGNLSQHSWGGAIDIGSIGMEGYHSGAEFALLDPMSHTIFTDFCELVLGAPASIIPTEIGGPLDHDGGQNNLGISFYTNGSHKNHIHLGYASNRGGFLFPTLSGRNNESNNIGFS